MTADTVLHNHMRSDILNNINFYKMLPVMHKEIVLKLVGLTNDRTGPYLKPIINIESTRNNYKTMVAAIISAVYEYMGITASYITNINQQHKTYCKYVELICKDLESKGFKFPQTPEEVEIIILDEIDCMSRNEFINHLSTVNSVDGGMAICLSTPKRNTNSNTDSLKKLNDLVVNYTLPGSQTKIQQAIDGLVNID